MTGRSDGRRDSSLAALSVSDGPYAILGDATADSWYGVGTAHNVITMRDMEPS
jgi:hypothetical protein